jgi:transcriptional regulator with XRE-family HTH domain
MGQPKNIAMAADAVLKKRRDLGLTQREISNRLGVTEKTYRQWEKLGASRMGALMFEQLK